MRFTSVLATLVAVAAAAPTVSVEERDVEAPKSQLVDVHIQMQCRDYDKYFWCIEQGCQTPNPDLCFPGFTCAIIWCT
ncbi:uncharacterized protein CTRU02_206361 [Colletotrichum truncatum]|uniref:Uncharacterized protein n=1 Tax=Colletotrichum truncatum TaxID=5467 RepID=A0ACC3Z6L4_COLTU|nr:uncharacterized protein CTRU02_09802 [Colletotrichum truncatum]KAF6787989.1 hypothetical protein CTRU02_09802 [Colletotrichum truncatum]